MLRQIFKKGRQYVHPEGGEGKGLPFVSCYRQAPTDGGAFFTLILRKREAVNLNFGLQKKTEGVRNAFIQKLTTKQKLQCENEALVCLQSKGEGYNFLFNILVSESATNLVRKVCKVLGAEHVGTASLHETLLSRAVTKISSCWINTTSRRGIKQLGISFGSIFLLFSYENSRGPCS